MDIRYIERIKKNYSSKELLDLMVKGKVPCIMREFFKLDDVCECGDVAEYGLVLLEHTGLLTYRPHFRFMCRRCYDRFR